MNERALGTVTGVGRVPPAPGAKTVKQHNWTISTQTLGNTLHQHGLTHTSCSVEDQRGARRTRFDDYLVEYRALNDPLDGWESVGCRIKPILILDLKLSKNGDTVDAFVTLASGPGLDPDEIAQLEQALFSLGIARLAPCGEDCSNSALGIAERAERAR